MLTTSVEAICFNYRPKKDNTYPIMLRLTKSGKRKYVSLGVSVKEEHWDFKKNTPKRNCPDRDFILSIIEKRVAEYRARINEYRLENKDYTLETLVQRTENPVRSMSSPLESEELLLSLTPQDLCRQVYNMNSENSELALVKLMELFNHSSVAITKRYLGLRQEEILQTYDCLIF